MHAHIYLHIYTYFTRTHTDITSVPSRGLHRRAVGCIHKYTHTLHMHTQTLLVCLVAVCIVELWDELQVALMLTALMLGMWSLQRYVPTKWVYIIICVLVFGYVSICI